jgi:16S rRNA (cytosine1402-N4)-methyltransferase
MDSASSPRHWPVLPDEVLTFLSPKPGEVMVDATLGVGGHSLTIAQAVLPGGRLIALDQDSAMISLARPKLEPLPVTLVHNNFEYLREILDGLNLSTVDGLLADLGVCSDQLDSAERGFSFQQSGPLDMRMDASRGEPASELLRRLNERDLAYLIFEFGEERFSRRIARRIVEARQREPITTTEQLAELVRRCVPRPKGKRPSIDPATRTFQALRIAVNDELGALDRLLAVLPRCLKPGGRAVLISFHSLEDRRVKLAFRDREIWEVLTPKPIQAGEDELSRNPRARSAKLRAARKR